MNLHNDIMNIPANSEVENYPSELRLAYKVGHRDARHAAAELSLKYERALEMALFSLKDIAEYGRVTSDDASESCKEYLKKIQEILDTDS